MKPFKIGIRLESIGKSLRPAIFAARRLGVGGVQADAIGDLSPRNLSQTGRRAFRNLLRSHNLEMTALGCPLRRGLDNPDDLQQRVDYTKAVLGLSVDLGARIAIAPNGRVSERIEDPNTFLPTEALQELGHHGDKIGAVLALATGGESGATLAAFLQPFSFDTASLRVNLDPANLLLHGFDPCESALALRGKVVHVRATDVGYAGAGYREAPLGRGNVDWAKLLSVLEEIGYHGWLTIERNSGANRSADVAAGIGYLGQLAACPV